jgi:hypothetical protein
MFEEYQSEVLLTYGQQRTAGALALNLAHPTPAKLKKECTLVFDRRYVRKDEKALSSFFGQQPDSEGYRLSIKKCEVDTFRPLNYFLKGEIIKTNEKNIELLAWLIDFQPRPYTAWLDAPGHKAGNTNPHEKIAAPEEPVSVYAGLLLEKIGAPVKTVAARPVRNAGIALLILALATGAAYLLWPKPVTKGGLPVVRDAVHCMYWTGDHYALIPCDQRYGDALIVPLDTFKLAHFRMITDTGRITLQSVGHVWYFKTGKSLACFTGGGAYPIDTNRRLRPITAYMIHKYFHH